jgi:hypothetical protein
VRWLTENNRPINIINDRELRELLMAGRPHISLPGRTTIVRDINASYLNCRKRVTTLLHVSTNLFFRLPATDALQQAYTGRLHIATDAWTSPNHRAFVAWTVHFQYKGEMLGVLIDINDVPEVSWATGSH